MILKNFELNKPLIVFEDGSVKPLVKTSENEKEYNFEIYYHMGYYIILAIDKNTNKVAYYRITRNELFASFTNGDRESALIDAVKHITKRRNEKATLADNINKAVEKLLPKISDLIYNDALKIRDEGLTIEQ